MGVIALASEQLSAELVLQLLDGAREGRLRDVAALGGAREVQSLGDGDEIVDLV